MPARGAGQLTSGRGRETGGWIHGSRAIQRRASATKFFWTKATHQAECPPSPRVLRSAIPALAPDTGPINAGLVPRGEGGIATFPVLQACAPVGANLRSTSPFQIPGAIITVPVIQAPAAAPLRSRSSFSRSAPARKNEANAARCHGSFRSRRTSFESVAKEGSASERAGNEAREKELTP